MKLYYFYLWIPRIAQALGSTKPNLPTTRPSCLRYITENYFFSDHYTERLVKVKYMPFKHSAESTTTSIRMIFDVHYKNMVVERAVLKDEDELYMVITNGIDLFHMVNIDMTRRYPIHMAMVNLGFKRFVDENTFNQFLDDCAVKVGKCSRSYLQDGKLVKKTSKWSYDIHELPASVHTVTTHDESYGSNSPYRNQNVYWTICNGAGRPNYDDVLAFGKYFEKVMTVANRLNEDLVMATLKCFSDFTITEYYDRGWDLSRAIEESNLDRSIPSLYSKESELTDFGTYRNLNEMKREED